MTPGGRSLLRSGLVVLSALGCMASESPRSESPAAEVHYYLSLSLEPIRYGRGKILALDDIRAVIDRGFQYAREVDPELPRFVFAGWTESTVAMTDGVSLVTLDRRRGPAEGEPLREVTEVHFGSLDGVVTDLDVVLFGSNVPWTVRNAWDFNEIPLSYRLAHDVCLALGVDHELLMLTIGGLGGFGCLNDEPEREGEW